jgi:hypothetical protein
MVGRREGILTLLEIEPSATVAQSGAYSLYRLSDHFLVFVTETQYVLCEFRTGFLIIFKRISRFIGLSKKKSKAIPVTGRGGP